MAKSIVICYDGTNNEFGMNNTNVVKLFRRVLGADHNQVAFYDPGVGTFNPFKPNAFLRPVKVVGNMMGNAFGWGLKANLEDGYRYLMNTYEKGDYVYLFGFSRGAYTARALGGMLAYFGLLEKGNDNLVGYVSKYYVNKKFDRARGFKETFCRPCTPYFVGVWDTVASLDYFGYQRFYDAQLKKGVKYGYQAVSIDEKRSKFMPNLWDESNVHEHQVIEQVWFPGVHSDVGGGYAEQGLSDIALIWMLDKAQGCGLKLRKDWRKHLSPDPGSTIHKSYNWKWWLLGKKVRRIPEGGLVHQSVVDRKEKDGSYRPELPSGYRVVSNASYQDY